MTDKTKKLKYFDQQIKPAAALGLAALVLNAALFLAFGANYLPVGNIPLFWATVLFSPINALLAFVLSVVPLTLLSGDTLGAARLFILCSAIHLIAARKRSIPPFVVALLLWLALFGPLYRYLCSHNLLPGNSWTEVVFKGLIEVVLVMLAAALLLNRDLWSKLTHKPRLVAATDLLIHLLAVLVTLGFATALIAAYPGVLTFRVSGLTPVLTNLVLFVIVCLYTASIAGWWFTGILNENAQELFARNMLMGSRKPSFSGLASDYWRRHNAFGGGAEEASPSTDRLRATGAVIAPDQGICALTRSGTISFINRKFKALTELHDNEVLGRRLEQVVLRPELKECLMQLVERTFCKGSKTVELKLNQLPDKLRFFEISSQFSAAYGESTLGDGPDSVIISVRDITDRRSLETHLLQAQRLAALGNMVQGLAHSFNNALTAIAGEASAAKRSSDLTGTRTALEDILQAVSRAGSLVRQLLDYADSHTIGLIKTDLRALITGRLDLLRQLVGEHVELAFQPSAEPIGVTCDENLIIQLVTNLTINSKEAIGDNPGSINLSLSTEEVAPEVADLIIGGRPGTFARLKIEDNGTGMAPDILARACDPLFTTKAQRGHPGLGLSIVYGVVRAHDGFLSIESHPNKGTTVSVYLPLQKLEPIVQSAGSQPAVPAGRATVKTYAQGNKGAILVVEDDDNVREVVSSMLGILGYSVSSCASGPEALELYAQTAFDLVLADMMMPKMTGAELITTLRARDSRARALMMTAYGIKAEELAPDVTIIPKPFDIDTLAQAVADSLKQENP